MDRQTVGQLDCQTVSSELAVTRNGSLEATGRRATLFARLLDENGQRLTAGRTRS